MSRGKLLAVLAAAAGWGAVLGIAVFGHPAVRLCPELGVMGRDLGTALESQQVFAGYLAKFDRGALPAVLALQVSVLYILLFVLWRLAKPAPESGPAWSAGVLGCGLVAHGAATALASRFGAAAFYAIAFIIFCATAAVLAWKCPAPAVAAGPSRARRFTAAALAWAIPLVAIPADTAISAFVHAPPMPEGWFVAVVSGSDPSSLGWLVAMVLLLPAVAWLLEAASRPGSSVVASLVRAPAAILLFGPSNPVRGLLLVIVLDRLARSGAPVWVRAAVTTAVVATPALLYLKAG